MNGEAEIEAYEISNYSSCFKEDNRKKVDESIRSGLKDGKYVITKDKPKCIHALGVISQHNKHRIITDCSRPNELAINGYVGSMVTVQISHS